MSEWGQRAESEGGLCRYSAGPDSEKRGCDRIKQSDPIGASPRAGTSGKARHEAVLHQSNVTHTFGTWVQRNDLVSTGARLDG